MTIGHLPAQTCVVRAWHNGGGIACPSHIFLRHWATTTSSDVRASDAALRSLRSLVHPVMLTSLLWGYKTVADVTQQCIPVAFGRIAELNDEIVKAFEIAMAILILALPLIFICMAFAAGGPLSTYIGIALVLVGYHYIEEEVKVINADKLEIDKLYAQIDELGKELAPLSIAADNVTTLALGVDSIKDKFYLVTSEWNTLSRAMYQEVDILYKAVADIPESYAIEPQSEEAYIGKLMATKIELEAALSAWQNVERQALDMSVHLETSGAKCTTDMTADEIVQSVKSAPKFNFIDYSIELALRPPVASSSRELVQI